MDTDNGVASDSSSFEDLTAQELTTSLNENVSDDKKTHEDEWFDVLGSGCLKKKIIKEGLGSETRPQRTDVCTIRLIGKLENGTIVEEFDKLKVQVGDLEVVQGIDLVLPLMNVGEVCLVEIEPRLAYGDEGRLPDIPPNSKITYEIELFECEPEAELEKIPVLIRKKIGNKKRERGNWWYARNESNYAIQCYRRALDYLDDVEGGITEPTEDGDLKPTDSDLQDLLEDRMKVYNNMAAAQMTLQAYDAALKCVDNVLLCQPQNVKALFRKAKILISKHNPEEARVILKKAFSIDPSNVAIQKELRKLIAIEQKARERERNMAKLMLQTTNNESNKQSRNKKSKSMLLWAPIIGMVAVGIAAITAYKFKYD
ncbi:peptidyl-prolyl cis-trans isomerase FKBP8 [Chrysoperla carnea]|uniref:peptidyl-prolyl cis-trans isomerase FKBP8 n=1 Tax=Chrysoperla carnea TaxID=189513 RepID=UPI001D0828A3|nr:peptidyl-prolyl cis-trans isomerase FKBP8 [Chrysoperla carnea]XP_044736569.1 peptidyl-prolyl cis-trans isomerase FKBP8 [Chrysoperla carnea]